MGEWEWLAMEWFSVCLLLLLFFVVVAVVLVLCSVCYY